MTSDATSTVHGTKFMRYSVTDMTTIGLFMTMRMSVRRMNSPNLRCVIKTCVLKFFEAFSILTLSSGIRALGN